MIQSISNLICRNSLLFLSFDIKQAKREDLIHDCCNKLWHKICSASFFIRIPLLFLIIIFNFSFIISLHNTFANLSIDKQFNACNIWRKSGGFRSEFIRFFDLITLFYISSIEKHEDK